METSFAIIWIMKMLFANDVRAFVLVYVQPVEREPSLAHHFSQGNVKASQTT